MSRLSRIVLCGLMLCGFSLVKAQESETEKESFSVPLVAPWNNGEYGTLNKLPEDIRKSKPYARFLHDFRKAAGESGVVDAEARYRAFEQSQSHLVEGAFKQAGGGEKSIFADAWTNIGPSNRGGCTKALAIHPTDPNTIYAGAAGGGVWKSTNGGSSWVPLTDLVIPDLAMASIAIDPSNPSNVFAATGDPSPSADGLGGSGLYRSTNGGAAWTRIASTTLPRTVNKVLVHPTNTNIVFACNYDGTGSNGKGLYRSVNGGSTFTRAYPTTANATGIIWDIVPGATIGGKTIFYLVEGNNINGSSTECGIYKSIDDGATWGKLTSNIIPAGNTIGKAALACPKLSPSKVYCLMATPSGALQGLIKSTDNGNTFTKVNSTPSTLVDVGSGAQGWYDLCLGVSPNSNAQDTVLIGGVEAYYSYNGGSNWTAYSDYNNNSGVHVDHHAIIFDPISSKKIYIGNDGGIYKSTNAGQSWTYNSTGYNTMRFYHVALDKSDYKRSLAGSQDQGTWQTTTGQAASFKLGGDGFNTMIDPNNSNNYYGEGPFGQLYRVLSGSQTDITGSNFEAQSDWDTPFILAPKSSTVLYTGRTQVWKSTNQGDSWASVSPVFSTFIYSLAVSPSNASVIYAGLSGGAIRRTTDGGQSWNNKNVSSSSLVESFACHPRDEDWALVSLAASSTSTARMYKTTNGGTNWINVSGSGSTALPGVPVRAVALDSNDPDNIWYAATDNGMYYTRNAGTNWSIAGAGIGLAPCWDVQVHSNKITIRVATHGRSLWEANTGILPVELTGLEAIRTATGTKLHWRTDSERQNHGFWVQRSYAYGAFEDLQFVAGNGTSTTPHEYDFFDSKHDDGYYIYRLRQVDLDGTDHLSNIVEVRYGSSAGFRLDQNYPNPFVVGGATAPAQTHIRYALAEADVVTMKVYSPAGQLIRTLINAMPLIGGEQEVFWDGTDDAGKFVASGAYFYTIELQSGGTLTNKLIILSK